MIDCQQAPTSLCLFRLSAIGDVTHILPVIHRLKKSCPQIQITWVIGKLEYQLVKSIPDIEFIVFDKSRGWREYFALGKKLKSHRFDVLLMMQAALRASIASMFIRAETKLGFDEHRAIDGQSWFSNKQIQGNSRVHVLEGFYQFLDYLQLSNVEPKWELPVQPLNAKKFNLPSTDADSGSTYIVINPCSSSRKNNWRNWTIEGYSEIADALHNQGFTIVLTGGPSDEETTFCQKIEAQCKNPPINLSGKTTLDELLAIIDQARLLIAPDTGPAHMATVVDTPVIGLYASSNPQRTGPYRSLQYCVNRYPDALKKYSNKTLEVASWGERVRHPDVMSLIKTEDVIAKVNQALADTAT